MSTRKTVQDGQIKPFIDSNNQNGNSKTLNDTLFLLVILNKFQPVYFLYSLLKGVLELMSNPFLLLSIEYIQVNSFLPNLAQALDDDGFSASGSSRVRSSPLSLPPDICCLLIYTPSNLPLLPITGQLR